MAAAAALRDCVRSAPPLFSLPWQASARQVRRAFTPRSHSRSRGSTLPWQGLSLSSSSSSLRYTCRAAGNDSEDAPVATGSSVETVGRPGVPEPADAPAPATAEGQSSGTVDVLGSGLFWVLWAALVGYAFLFAPDQQPYLDQYLIEKLSFLHLDDGFKVNQVVANLWNSMGAWAGIFACLLLPTGRSAKGSPPTWPYVAAATFVGAFAILPYCAQWRPRDDPLPPEDERDGVVLKAVESKITAGLLTGVAALSVWGAVTAGGDSWEEYIQLIRGSRFLHITSIDFCTLTLLCPFWMYNDMEARKWDLRNILIAPFSLLPVLGPSLYLLLRPPLPLPASQPSLDEA